MLSEPIFKHRVSNKDFWKRTSEPCHVMQQGSATGVINSLQFVWVLPEPTALTKAMHRWDRESSSGQSPQEHDWME
jgi:hypothetical protein